VVPVVVADVAAHDGAAGAGVDLEAGRRCRG
jgi:hypothetical protein